MKKFITSFLFLAILLFTSCEDVIDINIPAAPERLVIEASLNWQKGTMGNSQTIKLSTSTPYFDTSTNSIVIGASVKVTNINSSAEYIFADQNDGRYTISNFIPVINDMYSLEVIYNNQVYTAIETMTSVPSINSVEQSIEGGFDDEVLDVTITWDDPEDEENFYFVKLLEQGNLLPELWSISDEFSNGNEMNEFFEKEKGDDDQEEFNPGDVVDINLYGISEDYYNYIQLLIEQYAAAGNQFSTTPAEIKGNCINATSSENYAFGYFRLTEVDTVNYTFE